MKLFLATSFSGQVDSINHQVLPEYRQLVESLLTRLRALDGVEVFAAIEQEDWRVNDIAPEVGVTADLAQIEQADAVLALLSSTISAGVQFEIGFAHGKGKQVFIARQGDLAIPYFDQGAVSAGLITLLSYDSIDMLVEQFGLALAAPQEAINNL